jgi:UDP-N-acetylglucosamine--N-acetylmuramyl-(pentapeptide) pyrophosphoryl-undecaprenol N-acetylglucosamine transferase
MEARKDKFTKLAITCGGTGGHFYPGLAIAREFQAQGGKALLLLSGKHTESQSRTAADHGIESVIIPSPMRPSGAKSALLFIANLTKGIIRGRKALKKFKPDAFLAMGSFASISGALAAKMLKTPIFLHDGNARIGKANLFLSRWAKHLSLSFPAVNGNECACQMSCSGLPVRPELLNSNRSKEKAIEKLNQTYNANLVSELPVVLIFGGSQGAKTFNETAPTALINLERNDFQAIHLAGAGKLADTAKIYKNAKFKNLALESSNLMGEMYSAADIVLCRSGGSTVSELAIFGKYTILVPYPYAANKHQDDNAAYLAATGGALSIQDSECDVEKLTGIFSDWLENVEDCRLKGLENKKKAKPEAAKDVLESIRNAI